VRIVLTWLRLEVRRRWVSLVVLALLVAVSTATVLTAAAGARRGDTALDRLEAQTLPSTVAVLANQPGFNWNKIKALPEVAALTRFPVTFNFVVDGCPGASTDFPMMDPSYGTTIERPVIIAGRRADPSRADEVVVTPQFLTTCHHRLGDTLTLDLATPKQVDQGYDGSQGAPAGPRVRARIVGVGNDTWDTVTGTGAGQHGAVISTPGLYAHYPANMIGTSAGSSQLYINALIRLKGGDAAIPAFRADLARVSGRSNIDVPTIQGFWVGPIRRIIQYETACLLAFGLAALVAALFLVGQAVARYTSATMADLTVLQSVGMTSRQVVAAASAGPLLAAAAGATLGVAGAIVASRWMPIGAASYEEPHPGINIDGQILGAGWVLATVLVTAASAGAAALALAARRRQATPRRSGVAAAAATAGLPVPLVVGARFALEPGRGRAAVPVRPALLGAVVGVLGVLAAFTFSAGVSDASVNPARFGQTWQLETFVGEGGQDFSPATSAVLRAVAADPAVTGVDDALIGGAQSGQVSVESFTYDGVSGKQVPAVLTGGRMPASASEIVLGPTTAKAMGVGIGSTIRLTGGPVLRTFTVTGTGFVPTGPHNSYDDGAWLTPAGFARLFHGAQPAFKFHAATVSLRPGTDVAAAARRLTAIAARFKGGQAIGFGPASPPGEIAAIKEVAVLPLALAAFLALLAVAAIGYALSLAVRRRRHELAVLRALGLTRGQTRLVVVTQATLLAVIGLAFGIPLGVAAGRTLWRAATGMAPLAYHTPAALWALVLIAPLALVVANLLAAWPGRRAARLRTAEILRTE
jgi:ABC-type lipoprotein release transport system permease subunit